MKRLWLLLLILPLTGCFGKAMQAAHKTQGEYLLKHQSTADEIFVGAMGNWRAGRKAHLDTIEAYTIEKEKDADGNIPVTRLVELREFRKGQEAKDEVKFAEVRKKWADNHEWFNQAMALHAAVAKWLGMMGLF